MYVEYSYKYFKYSESILSLLGPYSVLDVISGLVPFNCTLLWS